MTTVDDLEPGDVLFWSADTSTWRKRLKHFVSWRIQAHGRSPWNHVALYDRDLWADRPVIIEATAHGVQLNPLSLDYDGEVWAGRPDWEPPLYDAWWRAVMWARGRIGTPYGYADIAACLLWDVTGWYPLPATHALICSELVGLALAEGGNVIVPENGVVWTPADIARAVPPNRRLA